MEDVQANKEKPAAEAVGSATEIEEVGITLEHFGSRAP